MHLYYLVYYSEAKLQLAFILEDKLGFIIAAIKIIFLLGFLIIIHEGGHFIVAKLCKVRVNEFSIGFGPKIWSKQMKETRYELRLIPCGGFVNMEGEEEHSDKEGSFSKASIPKRFAIVVAGASVNIIFGLIAYMILIFVQYMLVYEANFVGSLSYAWNSTGNLIYAMFDSIVQLFSGNVSINDMMGPVGISQMVSQTSGLAQFVYLLSIVSISLGITNLLPFVPLDGGKALLLIIEAIRRKPLKQETELKIQSAGFFILIVFSAFVAYNDILRIV